MMTKFESYPFLEIARTYGADYGKVLLYADAMHASYHVDHQNPEWHRAMRAAADGGIDDLSGACKSAIITMCSKAVHERRGTPRAPQA